MGVKVGVCVSVNVCVDVNVSVGVWDGVEVYVAVGVGQMSFVKLCVQTGEVVPSSYMLKVNEQPFISIVAKPCDGPI